MIDHSQTVRSLVWTALESGGLALVSFVTLVVLSRYLTPVEFGIAALALAVIQIINIPVEVFFHDALVQRPAVDARHYDTAFTLSITLGALFCAGCWLARDAFAHAVGEPRAGEALAWMSLGLLATGSGAAIAARLRREMRFEVLAKRSLVGRFGAALIAVVAAIAGAGIWSLILQQVAMAAIVAIALWAAPIERPRLRFSGAAFREMRGFGLAVTSVTILWFSYQRVFTLLAGAALGTAAAGYLNFAFRVVDMLRDVVGRAIAPVSTPVFARLQHDPAGMRRAYCTAVEFTCVITYPLFLGLLACTPEIIAVLFGRAWLPAAPFFALLAALTLCFFPRIFALPAANAVAKPHFQLPSGLANLAVVTIGMLTVGRMSLDWAAAVWAAGVLIALPIDVWMLRRASGLSVAEQFRGVPRVLAAAASMALVVRLVRAGLPADWPMAGYLAVMIAVGAASYVALLLLVNRTLVLRLLSLGRALRA